MPRRRQSQKLGTNTIIQRSSHLFSISILSCIYLGTCFTVAKICQCVQTVGFLGPTDNQKRKTWGFRTDGSLSRSDFFPLKLPFLVEPIDSLFADFLESPLHSSHRTYLQFSRSYQQVSLRSQKLLSEIFTLLHKFYLPL
jgi:hypothetical protein